jgi:uncharacterized damage-inducible protein DinB
MTLIDTFLKEMEEEANTTRKMLSAVPDDKFSWQPHPKSMTIERLSNHIAELPFWVVMTLTTEELDFANNPYKDKGITNTAGVLEFFEQSLAQGKAELAKATEEQLEQPWVLRNGDYIISKTSKAEVIRMAFCQTVHHRAQLGVFLRLLDVPIPGSYGPSADENSAAFKA